MPHADPESHQRNSEKQYPPRWAHTLKDTRQTGSLRGHSRGAARTRLNLSILQTPRHVTKSARTPRPTPRRLRSPQGPAEPCASDRDTKTPHMTRIDKHRAPTHTAQGSRLTPVTSILVGRHPCNGARESTERPPASPRPRAAGCTACAAPRSLLSQRARSRHRVHAGVRPGWPTPQGGPLLRVVHSSGWSSPQGSSPRRRAVLRIDSSASRRSACVTSRPTRFSNSRRHLRSRSKF
jgi:hypothetical protein